MARVTIEDCLKKMNNRFMLVHLGAKRVIQLRKGAKPLADAPKNKEIVLALREIAAGEITIDSIAQMDQHQLSTKPERDFLQTPESMPSSQEAKEEAPESEAEDSTTGEVGRVDTPPEETD